MIRVYVTLLTLLFTAFITTLAHAATTDEAKQFVDSLGKHVVGVVDSSHTAGDKQSLLRDMFSQNVDIDWMAKFVLGRGWQQATDDQRTRYLHAYREYLLTRYTTNFSDYTGSKYMITDAKADADGQFTVNMQIKAAKADAQNTLAGYRIESDSGGQLKIIDIIIEGVSLITTERSEFASVLQQKGMDGLIATIQEKTKSETQPH